MTIPQITLDTNLLHEHWKQRDRRHFVEHLVKLSREGKVHLAATARVREDVLQPPLSDNIEKLPDLNTGIRVG